VPVFVSLEDMSLSSVVWPLVALAGLAVFVFAVPLAGLPVLVGALAGLVIGGTLVFLRRQS